MYSRVLVAPPVEPVTLAEVKLDRAIDHVLHDGLLSGLIIAARDYAEQYCGLSLVTQTREVAFDAFGGLAIPFGPVQEIVSVSYYDAANVATVLAAGDYQTDLNARVARIWPAYASAWPTTVGVLNAVRVRYIAGFAPLDGSPTDYVGNVPSAIKQAIRLLVGTWYENRESVVVGQISSEIPYGVDALLNIYRVRTGIA